MVMEVLLRPFPLDELAAGKYDSDIGYWAWVLFQALPPNTATDQEDAKQEMYYEAIRVSKKFDRTKNDNFRNYLVESLKRHAGCLRRRAWAGIRVTPKGVFFVEISEKHHGTSRQLPEDCCNLREILSRMSSRSRGVFSKLLHTDRFPFVLQTVAKWGISPRLSHKIDATPEEMSEFEKEVSLFCRDYAGV